MQKLLNKRQEEILDFLNNNEKSSVSGILSYLNDLGYAIARITAVRDLDLLLQLKLINRHGKGRGVYYTVSFNYKSRQPIDIEQYFKIEPDEREINTNFNFDIFKYLKDPLDKKELVQVDLLNKIHQGKISNISSTILKKEIERITIELSWKSSAIEGNTYSLLDTELLLKTNKKPAGHSKYEADMILNHKNAFDFILKNKKEFKKINIAKIEELHKILIKNLNVKMGTRKRVVGIIGTKYRPLDNQYQIRESLEEMCKLINKIKHGFTKAMLAILLTSYIQPFEDGNKRTSRLLGNALLLSYGLCPLSYRSIDEQEYKKAVILFYEQNNTSFFKEKFLEQFAFSVKNYF